MAGMRLAGLLLGCLVAAVGAQPQTDSSPVVMGDDKPISENHVNDTTLQDAVVAPGIDSPLDEKGDIPNVGEDSSWTSPTFRHKKAGDVSPNSPVPLYTNPDFQADLQALLSADGNYSVTLTNIAQSARDAIQTTDDVFLKLVAHLFTTAGPQGKDSLVNRSGWITTMYTRDTGDFRDPLRGVTCADLLSTPKYPVTPNEAESICNEEGAKCPSYSCHSDGIKVECRLCSGIVQKSSMGWNIAALKPFIAKKSPDHMEWDSIVHRASEWMQRFHQLQMDTEALLEEQRRAVEIKFQTQLEKHLADPGVDHSKRWQYRLDDAWRQEQFEEANWYAGLMKDFIVKIDDFYNQVLNKLTLNVNKLNEKERAEWSRIDDLELANHSDEHDCWMAVKGVVYDFTYLVQYHPNRHSFTKFCGTDATPAWDNFQHAELSKTLHANLLDKRVQGAYYRTLDNETSGCNQSNESTLDVTSHRVKWHNFAEELQMKAFYGDDASADSSLLDSGSAAPAKVEVARSPPSKPAAELLAAVPAPAGSGASAEAHENGRRQLTDGASAAWSNQDQVASAMVASPHEFLKEAEPKQEQADELVPWPGSAAFRPDRARDLGGDPPFAAVAHADARRAGLAPRRLIRKEDLQQ